MFKEYFIFLNVANKYAQQEKLHMTLFFNLCSKINLYENFSFNVYS